MSVFSPISLFFFPVSLFFLFLVRYSILLVGSTLLSVLLSCPFYSSRLFCILSALLVCAALLIRSSPLVHSALPHFSSFYLHRFFSPHFLKSVVDSFIPCFRLIRLPPLFKKHSQFASQLFFNQLISSHFPYICVCGPKKLNCTLAIDSPLMIGLLVGFIDQLYHCELQKRFPHQVNQAFSYIMHSFNAFVSIPEVLFVVLFVGYVENRYLNCALMVTKAIQVYVTCSHCH